MSKELEALKLIMTRLQPSKDNVEKAKVEYETVKSALNDLTRLQKLFNQYAEDNKRMREYIDMVDKTFVDVETTKKKLKALEIIKNKRVEVSWLMLCFGFIENATNKEERDYYNDNYEAFRKSKPLTQEEFDLLKEVLKND